MKVKNWLRRNIGAICSTCLGTAFVYHISGASLWLFGEPEFPMEEE